MTQTQAPTRGGQFLTSAVAPDDVFIREELTEEQRMFGQTAAEFMQKEVLPVVQRLYEHDWVLTRQLLKKASDLDLLRLEIPPAYGGLGLDLISASYVGEQLAVNPSFGGSLGAHTSIGTLPLVYFGTEEQKARYLPRLSNGDLVAAYALTEPQSDPTRSRHAPRRRSPPMAAITCSTARRCGSPMAASPISSPSSRRSAATGSRRSSSSATWAW
jgi:alkylation response protein AidB-like acyl-CoA dehydrogenase